MFTGIIETIGRVAGVRRTGAGMELAIEAPAIAPELTEGQSVAVAGACLTVERHDRRRFQVTAVGETVRRTTLGELRVGGAVNLERALTMGGRLDGHLVQGHVDGVGAIGKIAGTPPGVTMSVRLQPELMPYVARKGSIAIDGVSLTVVDLGEDWFEVALVPLTLKKTTLAGVRAGHRVNIEVDLLARYLERFLTREGCDAKDHYPRRG